MRWIFLLSIISIGTGCAGNTREAEQALKNALAAHKEITYEKLKPFPGGVVCGDYQIIDKWDGAGPQQRFIVRDNIALLRPSKDQLFIFCDPDPADRLYQRFGIRADGSSAIEQINKDLSHLLNALEAYAMHNRGYPRAARGLQALVTSRADGYQPLPSLPVDPWGRDYLYSGPGLGGVKGTPKVYTLGADGKRGGKDDNADVSMEQLQYLDHINKL